MRRLALLAALVVLTACGGSDRRVGADGMRGGMCGDPRLVGEPVGRVPGALPGCGIDDAVRITAVAGVRLSQPALLDCPTARAFAVWVDRGAKRAVGRRGGGIERLNVAAHYSCRPRNGQPGAPISEHGRGKAIDISGIVLANGDTITLLDDWGRGRHGRALRKMSRAACGPFGTVLGPEADRFHQDHFHFDTARHRGGPYCR